MVQNREKSLCREIEEKVDQWGVNRVKAEAVVLPEGERETPWEWVYVSALSAAGRRLTGAVCPAPNRSARSAVLLWSGNHPQKDLLCNHLPTRCRRLPLSKENKPSFAVATWAPVGLCASSGRFASKANRSRPKATRTHLISDPARSGNMKSTKNLLWVLRALRGERGCFNPA